MNVVNLHNRHTGSYSPAEFRGINEAQYRLWKSGKARLRDVAPNISCHEFSSVVNGINPNALNSYFRISRSGELDYLRQVAEDLKRYGLPNNREGRLALGVIVAERLKRKQLEREAIHGSNKESN